MANALPKFKGKPIIEIPKEIPMANFLEEDFGKAVLEEYKGKAKKEYDNASALDVLFYEDNVVKGSNPFAVVLVNQIISKQGLRTATPTDLEKILKIKAINLRDSYEDSALVLRDTDNPNSHLAKNLYEQVKYRKGKKFKLPIMIALSDLELTNDKNSKYNLAFKLKENTELIYAPQLKHENNHKKFSKTNEKGLPIFNKNGGRTLYTIKPDLSGLCLYRDWDLGAYYGGLTGSGSGGRVVVVSAKGASENFDRYVTELKKEKDKQQAQVEEKFNKAMKILRE